jgi:hypothetical protein
MGTRSRLLATLPLAVLSLVPFSGCGGQSERTIPTTTETLEPCDQGGCALVWDGCCPPCGRENASRFRAVSYERRAAAAEETCPSPIPCPACPNESDFPIVAACTPRGCELKNLENDPAIRCTVDANCFVRTKDCCECGGNVHPTNLISRSDEPRFAELVCGPSQACDDCLPSYSGTPPSRCVDGRCRLER